MDRRFVIARNANKRPTLQHLLIAPHITACGVIVTRWSRAYQSEPIKEILCNRCRSSM